MVYVEVWYTSRCSLQSYSLKSAFGTKAVNTENCTASRHFIVPWLDYAFGIAGAGSVKRQSIPKFVYLLKHYLGGWAEAILMEIRLSAIESLRYH